MNKAKKGQISPINIENNLNHNLSHNLIKKYPTLSNFYNFFYIIFLSFPQIEIFYY